MVIVIYKCDKCGKEYDDAFKMTALWVQKFKFDVCENCLSGVVTQEMVDEARAKQEEKLLNKNLAFCE